MEPSGPAFEQIEFGAGVQRVLEALRIIRAVTLSGNDLPGRDNATDCIGPGPSLHDDRGEKTYCQNATNRCSGDPWSGFAAPQHHGGADADNRESQTRDKEFCLNGKIVMPEEQRL